MGWLQLVGSLKLFVSCAKEPDNRDYIFAKETYNFKEPANRSHLIDETTLSEVAGALSFSAKAMN